MREARIDGQEEQELVQRAQAGDRSAFDELARSMRELLLASIQRRIGPALREHLDPEDVLQETLLRAFRSVKEFRWQGRTRAGRSDRGEDALDLGAFVEPSSWLSCSRRRSERREAQRRQEEGYRSAVLGALMDLQMDQSIGSLGSGRVKFRREMSELFLGDSGILLGDAERERHRQRESNRGCPLGALGHDGHERPGPGSR